MLKPLWWSKGSCCAVLVVVTGPACVTSTWKPMSIDRLKTAELDHLRVVTKDGMRLDVDSPKVNGGHLYGRFSPPGKKGRLDLRALQTIEREQVDKVKATMLIVGVLGLVAALVVAFAESDMGRPTYVAYGHGGRVRLR